ncbi:MAG: PhzF family phenazine biosynthesis protein [Gammaproteobacteria bacterium]|nr:PhzF family phenazine biosynthesis protein [Gammaproteobacteria bacterium]MDE0283912.1 PhzF family phenazine biosynthesis protein [Gammaproteobacteria bacterium]
MQIPFYQINTFTSAINGGNPAGVCPLTEWLPDDLLLSIAKENNYSETAFFVPHDNGYKLRWFSPTTEIERCAHATLASAFVLHTKMNHGSSTIQFHTVKEDITVDISGDAYKLNMRAMKIESVNEIPGALIESFGEDQIIDVCKSDDYLVQVKSESFIQTFTPDYELISDIDLRGTILTAMGRNPEIDFVSRWFGSRDIGIKEDPVTGSAHCTLVPYWKKKLGKDKFIARQLSPRGGTLNCEIDNGIVSISGTARLYLEGTIQL